MTIDEARLFLGINDLSEDTEDVYLDRLHELKQQFTQQVPFKKLYTSRWKRMANIEQAYEVLVGISSNNAVYISRDVTYDKSESLKNLFTSFHHEVNFYKQAIYASSSLSELHSVTKEYYQCYFRFAEIFEIKNFSEDVKISQPPDEMLLMEEIRLLSEQGVKKISQLNLTNTTSVVVREVNRLSLWFKKENNE